MNFSPIYKIMCMKAEEIQKKWIPQKGDIYLVPQKDGGTTYTWKEETGPAVFRQGFAILRTGKLVILEKRIWLPRHNQLMELAQRRGVSFREMTYRFHEWTKKNISGIPAANGRKAIKALPSMEECWLAFVMARFHKKWNENAWAPVEETSQGP